MAAPIKITDVVRVNRGVDTKTEGCITFRGDIFVYNPAKTEFYCLTALDKGSFLSLCLDDYASMYETYGGKVVEKQVKNHFRSRALGLLAADRDECARMGEKDLATRLKEDGFQFIFTIVQHHAKRTTKRIGNKRVQPCKSTYTIDLTRTMAFDVKTGASIITNEKIRNELQDHLLGSDAIKGVKDCPSLPHYLLDSDKIVDYGDCPKLAIA